MGAKKKISKHPNRYLLADEMKTQLKEASDTVVAETITNHKKKVNPDLVKLRKRKKGLMKDLAKRNVDLQTYMISMGANTIKHQPSILSDPDPLSDYYSFSDDDDSNDDNGLMDDTIDDPVADQNLAAPPSPRPTLVTAPPPSRPVSKPTNKAKAPNKKGKRTKQKPIPESEDSFLRVESVANLLSPIGSSLGGDDLRNVRRQEDLEETRDEACPSPLTVAAIAGAGMTVLSRFVSRSSASRSSPRRSSIGRRPSINRRTSALLCS